MLKLVATLLVGWMCAVFSLSQAAEAPDAALDPALEKRVVALTEELRCLVCQNQTIADSHAELAIDLKNQVREMLRQGKSEKDIKQYMVARYGDFVLYRPEVKGTTWLLWGGPFVLLLGGLAFLALKMRRRAVQVAAADSDMTDEARKRAQQLLQSETDSAPRTDA